ncbi:DUF2254 domain-containing protein [Rubrivirga marina]|uniref:DUF2254 domain-containing protein n=1 Tax=Rubrivirga marina TaxID=1196024 RepID=UPI001C530625|nr:DUF2254 domain-containing protein [Rubrivirga marina]
MPPIHARAAATWEAVRASYWFIPSLMTIGAAVLSVALISFDGRVGAEWIREVPFLYGNRPEGARAVLSTIAGSMIGVAGVTFSITIASVVYASGQYGPRLLANFMDDRGNQVTLGTFIATFLYCLLVLRTIRTAAEGEGAVGEFVPHVAILVGLALAVASVGVLIYFIHHVPESIHVSNLVAGVGRDLLGKVDTLFPERIGEGNATREADGEDPESPLPDGFYDDAQRVAADGAGYVSGIDADAVLRLACEHDLLLRIRHRPGDFVADGDTLVLAWPPDHVTDETRDAIRTAFAWGAKRTARQDVRFLIDELVEIAARALSPGVNDPFTAIACLDWLGAALKDLAGRDFPRPERYDDDGALRVVAHPTTFEQFVGGVFGQLRPYLASDRNAALHALKTIGEVAGRVADERQRVALRHEADAILDGADATLALEADRLSVRQRHTEVTRLLSGRVGFEAMTARTDWIGGTA